MSNAPYVDPNSGAAPQPGGMVIGGAESQRGVAATEMSEAQEKQVQASGEAVTENPPTSPTEAELHRQVDVTQVEADAKQGTPDAQPPTEAKTPDLAQPTNEPPTPPEEEKKGDEAEKKGDEEKKEPVVEAPVEERQKAAGLPPTGKDESKDSKKGK